MHLTFNGASSESVRERASEQSCVLRFGYGCHFSPTNEAPSRSLHLISCALDPDADIDMNNRRRILWLPATMIVLGSHDLDRWACPATQ